MESGQSFLEVKGVSKQLGAEMVVKNLSLRMHRGERLAIAGETGSGKTTLMKMIAGIVSPDRGEVLYQDQRVKRVPEEKLIPGHEGIAYLSQHFELRNHYRMEELLSYANTHTGEEAWELYRICRIDHLLKRKTNELSGGERQRVALARLLLTKPTLLLLDEPFSNLDLVHKRMLKKVLKEVGENLGTSFILVSHDPLDTLSWAECIYVLQEGKIVQSGSPENIYQQPENAYVAGLFGTYNLFPTSKVRGLHGLRDDKPYLMIRPETFSVSHSGEQAVKGKIKDISFCGSYVEVIILAGDEEIMLRSMDPHLKVGQPIFLKLNPKRIWYIDEA